MQINTLFILASTDILLLYHYTNGRCINVPALHITIGYDDLLLFLIEDAVEYCTYYLEIQTQICINK
jgi:hypothetical protein